MICHSKQFIFIHIRKTAGTSLEAVLIDGANAVGQHYKPGKEPVPFLRHGQPYKHRPLCEFSPEEVENYFTFCIVRNPWDRVVSRYFWERKQRRRSVANVGDFRSYILARRGLHAVEWNITGDNPRKYMPQVDYISIDGEIRVDRIYRFERLDEAYCDICNRLELAYVPLPMIFTSNHEPYWSYYDDVTREIVAEAYRSDVEAFGYAFRPNT